MHYIYQKGRSQLRGRPFLMHNAQFKMHNIIKCNNCALCIMNYSLTKNEKCTLPYTLCWANCGRWLKSLALECSTMTKVPG